MRKLWLYIPKPKVTPPKKEDIFQEKPRLEKKTDDNKGILTIIKEKKLVIGIILFITLIVICGIVLMGTHNNNGANSNSVIHSNDLVEYKGSDFSFNYPSTWEQVNRSDQEHPDAVFFQNKENVTIEYYNITSSASSLKDITQQRITHAQESGDYVELVDTITLDGRNSSNMLLENANGDYTRYVSMFSDGKLYVFKITGSSEKSLTSEDIENTLNSADIA